MPFLSDRGPDHRPRERGRAAGDRGGSDAALCRGRAPRADGAPHGLAERGGRDARSSRTSSSGEGGRRTSTARWSGTRSPCERWHRWRSSTAGRIPLLNRGGTLVALKGSKAEEEIEAAKHVGRKLGAGVGIRRGCAHDRGSRGDEGGPRRTGGSAWCSVGRSVDRKRRRPRRPPTQRTARADRQSLTPPRSGRHSRRLPRRSGPRQPPQASRSSPAGVLAQPVPGSSSRCRLAAAGAGARQQPSRSEQAVAPAHARDAAGRDSAASSLSQPGTARDCSPPRTQPAPHVASAAADAAGTGVVTAGRRRPLAQRRHGASRTSRPSAARQQWRRRSQSRTGSGRTVDACRRAAQSCRARRRRPASAAAGSARTPRSQPGPRRLGEAALSRRRRLSVRQNASGDDRASVRATHRGVNSLMPARAARRRRPTALRVTIAAASDVGGTAAKLRTADRKPVSAGEPYIPMMRRRRLRRRPRFT